MIYTKRAVKAIKNHRAKCSNKRDICMLICNIIMPEWDNIIKELNGSISCLEEILHILLNDIVQYTKPILHKFEDFKNHSRHMLPCYNIPI